MYITSLVFYPLIQMFQDSILNNKLQNLLLNHKIIFHVLIFPNLFQSQYQTLVRRDSFSEIPFIADVCLLI